MKRIILLLSLLFITGCSVQYDLDIDNNIIKEVGTSYFSIKELENEKIEEKIRKLVSKYFINDDILIGQSTDYFNTNDNAGYKISNKYKTDEIMNISIPFYCYENVEIINNKNVISISTDDSFLCYNYYDELEEVTIHISSDLKNISNNADFIDGKDYYWYIKKDDSKSIQFSFKKDNNFNLYLIAIILIVIGLSVIVSMILLNKNKKNNQL